MSMLAGDSVTLAKSIMSSICRASFRGMLKDDCSGTSLMQAVMSVSRR